MKGYIKKEKLKTHSKSYFPVIIKKKNLKNAPFSQMKAIPEQEVGLLSVALLVLFMDWIHQGVLRGNNNNLWIVVSTWKDNQQTSQCKMIILWLSL